MSVYLVGQLTINDAEEYDRYLAGFMPIFQRHQGELLATTKGDTKVLEGEWAYPKTVIMKFPNKKKAESWFGDPEYKALVKHRHRSANANLVMIEGMS